MINRRTALTKVARSGWDGSYADSTTHSKLFRTYSPTYFGMMEGQMFSSAIDGNIINKPWMWLTAAQGNMMSTDPGKSDYCWKISEDVIADMRITRVDENLPTYPGKGNLEFKIFGDKGGFHEPVLFKTDAHDAPLLRVIGYPTQVSADEWEYTVKLQDGSPDSWLDPKYVAVGRRIIDGGTSTADELNYKYAGDSYANIYELQSQIGYVGRKIEVTDKFLRLEMDGKSSGMKYSISGNGGSFGDGAIGVGYTYQAGLADKTNSKLIPQGSFITMAEARLAERIAEDKNFMMEFGRTEVTTDPDTGRQIKVAPGWRQIRRDGNYWPHNGTLSLYDIYEKLNDLFITRYGVGEPEVILRTGKGGIQLFSRLVLAQAGLSPFTLVDTHFIHSTTSDITPNALSYGAQFTEILMDNGIKLKVMYDPMKDNPRYYPEKVPGTNYSYESFTFDILDLGVTGNTPGGQSRSNISMVYEEAYEEYYAVSNVYDFYSGAKKSGETVAVQNKEAGIYRGSSVALAVWDVSRIACLPFVSN